MQFRPVLLLPLLVVQGCTSKPEPLSTQTLAFIEHSRVTAVDLFKGLESAPDSNIQTRVKSSVNSSGNLVLDMSAEMDSGALNTRLYAKHRVKDDELGWDGHHLQLTTGKGTFFKLGSYSGWNQTTSAHSTLYSSSRRFLKESDLKSKDFYLYQPNEARGDNQTPQLSVGHRFGHWQTELATLNELADDLIPYAKESTGAVQVLRPSVRYSRDRLAVDLGLEHFLNSQQIRVDDTWLTVDQRTGFGMTARYQLDRLTLSATHNSLHSSELYAVSQGLSAQAGRFSIGVLQAENQFNPQLFPERELSQFQSVHASYRIPYLFNIPDLQMRLEWEQTSPQVVHEGQSVAEYTQYQLRFDYAF